MFYKNKIIVTYLVMALFLSFVFSPIIKAEQLSNTNQKALKIAKVGVALYLLSKLTGYINNKVSASEKNSVSNNREINIKNQKIIVIDPGHGGSDPGAVGPSGLREKDVNLVISKYLFDLLKEDPRFTVYLSRKDDRYISLSQRTAMANRLQGDIKLSIHSNADKRGIEEGIETYGHYNSCEKSWELAWYIQESLVKNLQLKDRGLKANNFQVIRETPDMKSLLLEIGYISNLREEKLLRKDAFRKKAAQAIYDGILHYYTVN